MTDERFAGRPVPADYMKSVANLTGARAYKALAHDMLELVSGLTVLDAGCGPGTDLLRLRDSVGAEGRVIGVDKDAAMLAGAAELDAAELVLADLHDLPLDDACVDRVKADRVLQHVVDPSIVLAELHRVSCVGAIAVVAEPDWGALVIDSMHPATSEAFTRFTCEQVVRNATLGREVGRLASDVGWARDAVAAMTTAFDDFDTADQVLGLGRNSLSAVDAGYLSSAERKQWLDGLRQAPVYAAATIVLTRLVKPDNGYR